MMALVAGGAAAVTVGTVVAVALGQRSYEPDTNDATETDLEGEYSANQVGTAETSRYRPGAVRAVVEHDTCGYYYVRLFDADGNRVGTGHRARHRIEAALDGPGGYDYVARVDGGQ